MPRLTKLPLEPLMLAGRYATAGELGLVLDRTRSCIQRLKNDGVPIHRADQFAIACGFHPSEVWGDDYYQALIADEAEAGTTILIP